MQPEILDTPKADRHGRLFKLNHDDGRPMTANDAGKIVKQIGKRAGVLIVKTSERVAKRAGVPIKRATETYHNDGGIMSPSKRTR